MNQAIDARDNSCERTEGGHANHGDIRNRADRILALEDLPRVVLCTLVAQGNLALLAVQTFDVYLYGVAHIDDLARMLNSAPGQLGDMDHSVDAAQVHKRTISGEGLHNTGVLLADLCGLPELVRQSLALVLEDGTNGTDRTAAVAVDLDDAEADFLLQQILQRIVAGRRCLGSGDKHAHAVGHSDHAALNHFGYNTGQNLLALLCSRDGFPALCCVEALLRKHDRTFLIVGAHDQEVHFVADFYQIFGFCIRVSRQLGNRNKSGLLSPNIYIDLVGGNADNHTVYLLICI